LFQEEITLHVPETTPTASPNSRRREGIVNSKKLSSQRKMEDSMYVPSMYDLNMAFDDPIVDSPPLTHSANKALPPLPQKKK
jgi:hypothetical protein